MLLVMTIQLLGLHTMGEKEKDLNQAAESKEAERAEKIEEQASKSTSFDAAVFRARPVSRTTASRVDSACT